MLIANSGHEVPEFTPEAVSPSFFSGKADTDASWRMPFRPSSSSVNSSLVRTRLALSPPLNRVMPLLSAGKTPLCFLDRTTSSLVTQCQFCLDLARRQAIQCSRVLLSKRGASFLRARWSRRRRPVVGVREVEVEKTKRGGNTR